MTAFDDLKARIPEKKAVGAVIGLGYVGLPLVASMCQNGLTAYGVDIDSAKIEALKSGESYIDAVSSETLKKIYQEGLLIPSDDFSVLEKADFIIICVPTPLNPDNSPDLSYVVQTSEEIAKHLRPGQVIVLESTTYPGTMRDVIKPIFNNTGLTYQKDYCLAYSPERENPGSKSFSTSTIPKVVGADTKEALELTVEYYGHFIEEVVPVSSMEVAEACKILENVYRAVNIALINELKIIFDRMDIDVWEVIEAAKTKPFGFTPFYPGPGLGGHCIPIDPFYLSWKAREIGLETRFIELAGEINTNMPAFVIEKLKHGLKAHAGKDLKGSNILILGIAYKKNVADQRETPAFPIMEQLINEGADIAYYDPHIPEIKPNRNHPKLASMPSVLWDECNIQDYDCIVVITDHDDIDYDMVLKSGVLIVDTRNVYKGTDIGERVIKA